MWCNSVRSTDPRKEVCGDNRVFVFCWRVFVIGKEEEEEEEVWDNWRKKKVLMISHRWEWVTSKLNPLSFSFSFCYLYSAGLSRHTPKKKGSSTPTNSPSILWILLHARQFSSSSFFFFLFYFMAICQFCSAFFVYCSRNLIRVIIFGIDLAWLEWRLY